MEAIIQYILIIPGLYLLFYSAYWLYSIIAGISFKAQKPVFSNQTLPEILVVLPAYKPGNIFLEVLKKLNSAIEGQSMKVMVLLQEARPEIVEGVKDYESFFIYEQSFSHHEGNSYHHALQFITKSIGVLKENGLTNPSHVMILDKDNLIDEKFFKLLNADLLQRYDIIQSRRVPLNAEGHIAFFDNVSEQLNDIMFRAAKAQHKSLIEISGSGALIRTRHFIHGIDNLDPKAPGYDKNFMVQMLCNEDQITSTYLPFLKVYEEKTTEQTAYNPQRVRWFGEQYYNALYSGKALFSAAITKKSWAPLDYLISLWRPPRSVQVMSLPLLASIELIYFFITRSWIAGWAVFTPSLLMTGLSILVFLKHIGQLIKGLQNLLHLPALAWSNFFNAIQSVKKENQGKFIHTEHKM